MADIKTPKPYVRKSNYRAPRKGYLKKALKEANTAKHPNTSSKATTATEWSAILGPAALGVATKKVANIKDLSPMSRRAMRGEFGAKKAQAAYRKLMESPDIDRKMKRQIKQYYENGGETPSAKDDSIFHQITHNPLTDALGVGLRALDKPKRAVVAGIEEGLEEITGKENKESFLDNVLRAKEYGFGDVVEDQNLGGDNVWVKRGLGLAGDIAFDPLTYITTGVKAAKGADAAADVGKAAKLAEGATEGSRLASAADLEKAAKIGGDTLSSARAADSAVKAAAKGGHRLGRREVAQRLIEAGRGEAGRKVARRGVSGASKADLEAAGLEGGLRFMGKKVLNQDVTRLPGRPLGRAGAWLGDTKAGKKALSGLGNERVQQARAIIRDPKSTERQVREALVSLRKSKASDLLTGRTEQMMGKELDAILAKAKRAGVDIESNDLRNMIEDRAGVVSDVAARIESQAPGLSDEFAGWLEKYRGRVNEFGGREVIQRADDYFPRRLSEEAQEAFAKTPNAEAHRKGIGETIELEDGTEVLLRDPAEVGRSVTDQIADVLEPRLRQTHPDATLWNQNAAEVLKDYNRSMARKTGRENYRRSLVEAGVVDPDALGVFGKGLADAASTAAKQEGLATTAAEDAGLGLDQALFEQADRAGEAARVEGVASVAEGANEGMTGAVRDLEGALAEAKAARGRTGISFGGEEGVGPDGAALSFDNPLAEQYRAATAPHIEAMTKQAQRLQDYPASWVGRRTKAQAAFDAAEANVKQLDKALTASTESLAVEARQLDETIAELTELMDEAVGTNQQAYEMAREARGDAVAAQKWAEKADTAVSRNEKTVARLNSTMETAQAKSTAAGQKVATYKDLRTALADEPYRREFQAMVEDATNKLIDLGGMGPGQAVDAPAWMIDAFVGAKEVAKDANPLLKFMDAINRGFKTWAIFSPGFHVRNFFGATFNNFVAGVDVSSYQQFAKGLRQFRKAGIEGVDEALRPYMARIVEGGLIDDGNRFMSEMVPSVAAGNERATWLTKNPLTEKSRAVGEGVERLHRGALAFDTMKKGGTFDEAVEKVYQFHFDYDDLSNFERDKMRRIIPFWTWTSRNMPLQMEQVWRSPKMYQYFMHAKDNFGQEGDPMDPDWIKKSLTGIGLGGGNYFMPDLPFQDVGDKTQDIASNPMMAALQDVTPALKAPLELGFGKQAWHGIPLDDKEHAVPTAWAKVPGLKQALDTLNVTHTDQMGKQRINGREMYMIEQALPLLGRVRRLFPDDDDKYGKEGRRLTSFLSFFGLGTRHVTEEDRQNEATRRGYGLEDLRGQLGEMGADVGKKEPKPQSARQKAAKKRVARKKALADVRPYELAS